jgi:hypothetical protein
MRRLFLFLFLVLPYIIVSLPGVPQWFGRTIATSMFIVLMPAFMLWYGLSPRTKMIGASGKLSQPQYDSVRPTIEKNIRVFFVLVGVVSFVYLTVPFGTDLVRLMGDEKPLNITGAVKDKSVPLFGLWFLNQAVHISQETKVKYNLYYSWKPLRVGETYQFVVLPRSRVILEFREP